MLVTPPCGASSNIALWRAKIKPPVELVVGDLDASERKSVLIKVFFSVVSSIANEISTFFNLCSVCVFYVIP